MGAATAGPSDPPEDRTTGPATPRALVAVAPNRYDDLYWENDRTAHRIYSRKLEAIEPPSSPGIDAWGKRATHPVMKAMIAVGDYHADHGEGIDFYSVHGSLGAGGLGIWQDNKLWLSRNYSRARILQNGPRVAQFEVDYAPWPVDVSRRVWETRRFTLPLGTSFTRMVSTIRSDKPGALTVAVGLHKVPTGPDGGSLSVNRKTGVVTFWTKPDPHFGSMGIALLLDPKTLVDVREDYHNHLFLLRERAGHPFVYYTGGVWDQGPFIKSQREWQSYADSQKADFRP